MKIIIETHDKTDEEIDAFVANCREEKWDVQINNYSNDPNIVKEVDNAECKHTYQNGICTKCSWLEI